jgi:hypothetical protein
MGPPGRRRRKSVNGLAQAWLGSRDRSRIVDPGASYEAVSELEGPEIPEDREEPAFREA